MIRVLNIISDSNIGGAGRCVLNFLKYYNREKFQIKVVVPRGSLLIPEIEKLDTDIIEADGIAEKSFDKSAVINLRKIIKRENPDIVHTHGNLSGRVAAKLCGKKVVYTRHSVFPVSPKISRGIGKFVNKTVNEYLSDDIMAVAQAAKDNLTEGGISPNKIKVILNGVEKVKECTAEENAETREKYGIKENDFVVGIMARMEPYKGHKYLVEAAEILKKKHKNIKVLIIGTGVSEGELKSLVKEKGMEETVVFTGFISDIRRMLGVMDLQANASYGTEATSLALLEGMSLGIPAVVSNYGGNPGVITHGENGYIFNLKDSADMAKYIEIIMEDNEQYEYMKTRSVQIFNEKFTAEIYARNIEKVYSGVLGNC
ncbi:MAG TPA: glycosyltransferase family 1 protein [Lachnospiraceae bacterium]|nr:glycosyltransferase family 1 protein [Lachnospiraceae bacterium]